MNYTSTKALAEAPAIPDASVLSNFENSFDEIAALAHETFPIAGSLCGSCRSYHSIWPYLRLTGRKRGVDADWSVLEPLLAQTVADGARRVLIAGSADTGLLSLVLSAAGRHAVAVTVIDTCETPLAMCRRFAARRGVAIKTLTGCLSEMSFDGDQDIVLAHSVLNFVATPKLPAVGAAFARALAPGGRLVLVSGLSAEGPQLDKAVYCDDALSALRARGVPLPAGGTEFRALLDEFVEGRRGRHSPFGGIDELTAYLDAHGLRIEELISKSRVTTTSGDNVVERSKPGVILVAGRS